MSFRSSDDEQGAQRGLVPGDPVLLTDVNAMRAMAHPARITLHLHLAMEGPATATECSPVVGLSPSACSYHLRQLARYGFVEQAPAAAANGRERPWRAKIVSTKLESYDDPATAMAADLLRRTFDEHWEEVRRRYHATEAEYPARWREVFGTDHSVLYATPAELEQLREQLRELFLPLSRLAGKERPEGAQPVQLLLDITPMFAPPEPGQS
jgi:predicted ArsR family transcriptional regulator